jgi:spore photoproduct lyase
MELIFMTYGYANMAVNKAALPTAMDVFSREYMKPKGRGKYMYKADIKDDAESYITALVHDLFPYADISYIV